MSRVVMVFGIYMVGVHGMILYVLTALVKIISPFPAPINFYYPRLDTHIHTF